MYIREYQSSDCKELPLLFVIVWNRQFKGILSLTLLLRQELFLRKEDIGLSKSNK